MRISRESFIEIYEQAPEIRLVTCIEVLSPSNKRPGTEGWELYLRKRNALLLGQASLVEIDLLRGGRRMPMVEPWPPSPYYLLVGWQSRGAVLSRVASGLSQSLAGNSRSPGEPRCGHLSRSATHD